MSAIGNYLKKLAIAIRNGKSSKDKNLSARSLADDTIADDPSTNQPRIITQKKKTPSKAHLSDFTIF